MEALQDVAHISGKPGLFRIIKPGRSGVIVESMDGNKKREIVSVNAKVSVLKDISIYSAEFDKSTPLADILNTLKQQHPEKIEFDVKKASTADFFAFFEGVMPDFDKERVYSSDIKKIIQWYNLLSSEMPELFIKEEKPAAKKTPVKKAEAKKPAAKKTAKKKE
jgi:hypothetical protein